jgi:hypothetical protein
VIRGESNRSGIYFILWDQLFERAKGFDEGGRNSSYFFLYHTFLWAFFPWSIIAYVAVVYWLKRMFVQKKWRHPFNFAALSFAFLLFAISFSKFKMPHYIIMLLPMAAMFTAPYLRLALSYRSSTRFYATLQHVFAVVVVLLTITLNFYFFRPVNVLVWVVGSGLLLILLYLIVKRFRLQPYKVILLSIAMSVVLNFFLNYNFFPQLMKYQAGKELVDKMKRENLSIPDDEIILIETHAHSFDFYRNHNHTVIDANDLPKLYAQIGDKYFLVSPFLRDHVEKLGYRSETIIGLPDHNVATISMKFLNPKTRHQRADSLMLVKFYKR